jgi:hypothetical protein
MLLVTRRVLQEGGLPLCPLSSGMLHPTGMRCTREPTAGPEAFSWLKPAELKHHQGC